MCVHNLPFPLGSEGLKTAAADFICSRHLRRPEGTQKKSERVSEKERAKEQKKRERLTSIMLYPSRFRGLKRDQAPFIQRVPQNFTHVPPKGHLIDPLGPEPCEAVWRPNGEADV